MNAGTHVYNRRNFIKTVSVSLSASECFDKKSKEWDYLNTSIIKSFIFINGAC